MVKFLFMLYIQHESDVSAPGNKTWINARMYAYTWPRNAWSSYENKCMNQSKRVC